MNIETATTIAAYRHCPKMPWRMEEHSHPFHELLVITRGSQVVEIDGRRIKAKPNDVLFYPAGVAHEEEADGAEGLESTIVAFEWADCPSDLPYVVSDHFRRIQLMAEWLLNEAGRQTPLTGIMTKSLARTVIAHYLDVALCEEAGFVESVQRMVKERIEEPFSLDDLAAETGMSKYHFIRRFKALTGRTPMQAARMMRIEYARELVLTTTFPLKEIAMKAGLGDIAHMTRLFRKHLGITPGKLRGRSTSRSQEAGGRGQGTGGKAGVRRQEAGDRGQEARGT